MEREEIERTGPGRRGYDKMKCPNCDLLWEHLAADRKANREDILEKVEEVKLDVDKVDKRMDTQAKAHSSFVPRWMFISAFGLMLAAGGWWFSSFGEAVKAQNEDIKEKVTVIHQRITAIDNHRESLKEGMLELKWSVNNLSSRVSDVEKKINSSGGKQTP